MEWWQQVIASWELEQVPLAGIVVLVVILVLRGWLSPRTVTDDLRGERDAWKTAYVESEKARGILIDQNGDLLEVAKTANHVLRSLGGDPDVATTPAPARK